jgi:hypothetical protein
MLPQQKHRRRKKKSRCSKSIAWQRMLVLEMWIGRVRALRFVLDATCVSRWLDLSLGVRAGGRALTVCAFPMRHAHWVDLVTMIPLGRSHTVLAWKGAVHHIGRSTSGRSWKRSSLESLLSWEPPTVRRALGPRLVGLHSWLLLNLDGQR